MLQALLGRIFGTTNDRELKRYNKIVNNINGLESKYKALNDDELRAAFAELKSGRCFSRLVCNNKRS